MAFLFESLIPRPSSVTSFSGAFLLPEAFAFSGEPLPGAASAVLDDALAGGGPDSRPLQSPLIFSLTASGEKKISSEAYHLEIAAGGISIESTTPAGLFRGVTTLVQMIRLAAAAGESSLPCGIIQDAPRFGWRGYMLDCSRHFQPADTIRRILDIMALYRMSVLHLHLTDDQGWRLEVPGLPELVSIGSRRKNSIRGNGFTGKKWTSGEAHEGHYTADDLRGIVAYAAERFIEVVPEIDVPGHVMSVLAAYPDLGCTGGPYEVPWKNGIFPDVLCVGNEAIWDFMEKVVSAVADIFPSKRIHFGGDEVPRSATWTDCPRCRAQRKAEGLSGIADQQAHFSRRLADLAARHGRQAMFWSEACIGNLDIASAGQFWLIHRKEAYRQLAAGRKILFSKHGACYLDMPYSYLPLRRAYAYDPALKPGLSAEAESNILGVETPMWTEWVPEETRLHRQSFPRTMALAERGWSSADVRDYGDFAERLRRHLPMLDTLGVGYAAPADWNKGLTTQMFRLFGRNW